jgi:RNA-directed DNA polymerase
VDKQGKVKPVELTTASSIPIKRHIKIQKQANPYDPSWEPYFEKRLSVKMIGNLKGKRRLIYLWKNQQGLCPICQQKITKLTGWHCHHIVWRVNGGGDSLENRVLLHPNCHRQLHNRPDLTVRKPGSSLEL